MGCRTDLGNLALRVKQCRAILAKAEKRIQLLTGSEPDGLEVAGEMDEEASAP